MSQDSLNEFDRSDLEGLKQELINSIPLETYSAPISPVSGADCLESFDLVTRSAPPSPRTRPVSNIQNLISKFEREIFVKRRDAGAHVSQYIVECLDRDVFYCKAFSI